MPSASLGNLRYATAMFAGALAATVAPGQTQQPIPVRELSGVNSRTSLPLGPVLGVRQLSSGKLLVNDATRRRLLLFDSTLKIFAVVLDSTSGAQNSYGDYPAPIIPYVGDSTLFVDRASLSLLVIEPGGHVARTMAVPHPGEMRFLLGGTSAIDRQGRLIFLASERTVREPAVGASTARIPRFSDSALLLRADFDKRTLDTLAHVKRLVAGTLALARDVRGKLLLKATVNPVNYIDDWAVLSDGTIAIVRGNDYHVDWIDGDGARTATGKLPFDWKPLSDKAKQQLIDSARASLESGKPKQIGEGWQAFLFDDLCRMPEGGRGAGSGRGGSGGEAPLPLPPCEEPQLSLEFPSLDKLADFYPPLRPGAASADSDGRLWVLPATSAKSLRGELVYDVIDRMGRISERVRVPVGRSVVGFGPFGIVYLMGVDDGVWYVERARLPM